MRVVPVDHDFKSYEVWFRDFTRRFLQGDEFDVANVQLKIDHTLRVLEFARGITAAQKSSPGLAELAHLGALFHDVGRFPQYARYRTFHDQISVNHAYQGVLTLKQHRVLEALPHSARKLVLGAVALHNRRFLPQGLSSELACITRIVRDADKLDIFAVMLAHFHPEAPHNKVVNLELKPHPEKYTPAILARVLERGTVNYYDMVWVNDFKLLLCSWIYDLNYQVSRKIAKESGYLEELMEYLPQSPEFLRLGQQLQEDLEAGGRN